LRGRQQRLETGTDWLDTGNREALRKKITDCEFPFRKDPSYIYRLQANDMIRFRKFFRAMQHASIAILRRPLIVENYRNFAQSLRAFVSLCLLSQRGGP